MRLSVVTPSWNGGELLARNLPEVVAQARGVAGGAEVLVVDDGSDRSDAATEIVADLGGTAWLVRLPEHRGFAAACNAGAAAAHGEDLLFLNNDVLPEAGCIAALLEAIEGNAGVFAVVPETLNVEAGVVESGVRLGFRHGAFDIVRVPPEPATSASPGWREVAYPCGGAFLCRRSAFHELGGFSQLYAPFYWEDVDLGWRARRAGLVVVETGTASVRHEHSRTISGRFTRRRIRAAFERNRLVFTWTHLAGARPWLVHLAWLPLRWLGALLRADAPLALPQALAAVRRVASVRRELRPSRVRPQSLVREVVASGRSGFPSQEASQPSTRRP